MTAGYLMIDQQSLIDIFALIGVNKSIIIAITLAMGRFIVSIAIASVVLMILLIVVVAKMCGIFRVIIMKFVIVTRWWKLLSPIVISVIGCLMA